MDVYFLKSAFFFPVLRSLFFLITLTRCCKSVIWNLSFICEFFLLTAVMSLFIFWLWYTDFFFLLNLSCHPLKTVKGLWKPDSQEHLGVFCSGRSWNFWLSAVFSGLGLLLGSVWRKLILRYIPFHLWSSSGFNPQWISILFIFLEN